MALTRPMLVLTQNRGPAHVFRRLGQIVALLSISVAQFSMDGTLGVSVALLKHSLNMTLTLSVAGKGRDLVTTRKEIK